VPKLCNFGSVRPALQIHEGSISYGNDAEEVFGSPDSLTIEVANLKHYHPLRWGVDPMPRILLSACLCGSLIAPSLALAQINPSEVHEHGAVACIQSPTPGKRPPNTDCAILLQKKFSELPPGPLVWRFENFPTAKAAQDASTPASVVVEAAGKNWLLTLAAKGGHSKSGTLVAETELLPSIPTGLSYEIVVAEADLGPEANVMTHKHSGPETWYLLSGEQCLELPDRAVRARVGQTMSAPAETPMKLNIVGPGKRDALFLIVHDSSKPFNTFLDWSPKGLCQK
jgi:quercetin dioxygenase-like cupin family protein